MKSYRLVLASIFCAAALTLAHRAHAQSNDSVYHGTQYSMPNNAGGDIVLTSTECPKSNGLHVAYSNNATGAVQGGCWFISDSQHVMVVWNDGSYSRYPTAAFNPLK